MSLKYMFQYKRNAIFVNLVALWPIHNYGVLSSLMISCRSDFSVLVNEYLSCIPIFSARFLDFVLKKTQKILASNIYQVAKTVQLAGCQPHPTQMNQKGIFV